MKEALQNKPVDRSRLSRRSFLRVPALSLGAVALSWMRAHGMQQETRRPELEPPVYDLLPKTPHHPPRATAMISLWMQGGPSHVDLCDPKPELNRLDGQAFPGEIKYDNAAQASSKILGSPWTFSPCGESGTEFSELLPHMGGIADELCLIRSMTTGVNNHGQSIRAMNGGAINEGRPVVGSWLTYALGAETQDLPPYLALIDPGQLPVLGVENWSQGFLPSLYQGTVIRPREPRIAYLAPRPGYQGNVQVAYLDFLDKLNRTHAGRYPGAWDLSARNATFGLASRMQSAATEALDLSRETEATRRLYGLDQEATADFGTRCLIARRLVERGVRFVQVFTQNQFWDHHGRIRTSLPSACRKVDQPAAALVRDLKQRGLLDSTVVHWGGEMGRLPVIQNDTGADNVGRDHNTYGFSMWLAGGGFRGGYVHGATDEFGHHAVEDVVHYYDYHATLLHLFGLDPHRVTYPMNEQDMSLLADHPGQIVSELLA